ncbi:hypothetical protein Tco_1285582, partial [Tanacetum coccineum]
PKKLDLSYSGLDEFKEPEFKWYGPENSNQEANIVCDKKSDDPKENSDNSLVKEHVSKDISSFVESSLNTDKETVFPVDKKGSVQIPSKGKDAVLMKTGLKTFYTARTVNTAHLKSTVFSAKPMLCFLKIAQSTVRRPFQSKTSLSNKRFTHKVNNAKAQAVNTARPQAVNTARPKIVKTARPNTAVDKPQQDDTGFVDSGCSRHMTGNIAYLLDFKEFDGGYVTFGGGAHGGRISESKTSRHVKRGWDTKIPQSSGPPIKVGDEAVHKELGDRMERAATTASSLEAEQGKGPTIPVMSHHTPTSGSSTSQPPSIQTIHVAEEAAPMPHDSPLLRVHSLGSEGSLSLNELTVLCTSLSKKVESLESELKQIKQTYSTALTKLIKRVKKLEQTIKTSQARRRTKVVISDVEEDEEDPFKQGRSLIEELDMDAGISLVPPHVVDQGRFDDTQVSDQPEEQLGVFSAAKVLADAGEQRRDVENVQTYTRRRRAVSIGTSGVSTASKLVSTAGVKAKPLCKSLSLQRIYQIEAKFKAEQEQERLDHETAMKLQEEHDAAERQRMAQVHQAAHGFTDDEWDDILARVAADKDFVQQLQAGEKVSDEDLPRKLVELVNQRKKFFAQQRAEAKRNKLMTHAQQKEYMSSYIKNQEGGYTLKVGGHTEAYHTFDDMLKKFDRDDLDKLWNLVKERFRTTEPTKDKARELWVELKRLFEQDDNDTL